MAEDVKAPNLFERVKEEIAAVMHTDKIHSKETHGTCDDIDENTPSNEVRAPNVFERAKEEIEAIVQTIHPKKEINQNSLLKEDKGFWVFLGKWFEKCCAPGSRKRGLES